MIFKEEKDNMRNKFKRKHKINKYRKDKTKKKNKYKPSRTCTVHRHAANTNVNSINWPKTRRRTHGYTVTACLFLGGIGS
jgi:hypothetical protein